jgi:hypothetical protein
VSVTLRSETNTLEVKEDIRADFEGSEFYRGDADDGAHDYDYDFEHGQWFVTELRTGRQWSVVDCETALGEEYFDFEEVSCGDDE